MDPDSPYYNETYCAIPDDYRAAEALNNRTVAEEGTEMRSEPPNSQVIEEEVPLQRREPRHIRQANSEDHIYDLPDNGKDESPSIKSTPSSSPNLQYWNLALSVCTFLLLLGVSVFVLLPKGKF